LNSENQENSVREELDEIEEAVDLSSRGPSALNNTEHALRFNQNSGLR